MKELRMVEIVQRVRYDTAKATLIAHDVYWDGHNFERSGRNTWLYKTPKGRYFYTTRTMWQGENDSLAPVSQDEAIEMYEKRLREHELNFEDAFPEVPVEEA